jgi:hypothetical protein
MRGRLPSARRLLPLEELAAKRKETAAQREQEAVQTEQAWQIMRATMSEEHIAMVERIGEAVLHGEMETVQHEEAFLLWDHCGDMIRSLKYRAWPYDQIPLDVFLAMPPEVAELLMQPGQQRSDECRDCGYALPSRAFSDCPLCDGAVARQAYYRRFTEKPVLGPQPNYRIA